MLTAVAAVLVILSIAGGVFSILLGFGFAIHLIPHLSIFLSAPIGLVTAILGISISVLLFRGAINLLQWIYD